jgi:serine/threonine protein kinase
MVIFHGQAKRKSDNKEFAIKIIKFQSNMDDVGKFRREAETLSKFDHKNIVRYFNSWVETAQIPISEYEKFKSDSGEVFKPCCLKFRTNFLLFVVTDFGNWKAGRSRLHLH